MHRRSLSQQAVRFAVVLEVNKVRSRHSGNSLAQLNRSKRSNPATVLRTLSVLLLLLAADGAAWAQDSDCERKCTARTPDSPCYELIKGNPKIYQRCVASCKNECQPPPTPPPVVLQPKFMVLGLVYAPPGCTSSASMQCNGSSSVDYAGGSSLGSKFAVDDSFKAGMKITTDALGGAGSAGVSAGFSVTQSDSSSYAVTKSASLELKSSGNADGIDHGQDMFILLLNPTVTLSREGANLYWHPGYAGPSMARYEVYVSELRNPSTMRPLIAAEFKKLGFTTQDYQTILCLDPFGGSVIAGGRIGIRPIGCGRPAATTGAPSSALDPRRFRPTSWSIPYEPPLQSPNCNNGICNCPAITITLKNDFVDEESTGAEGEYTVGLTTSIGIPKVWDLKTQWNFTWTSSSTTTSTTDSSQSASATIACPSVNYNGPTLMQVYWDALYGSFLFVPYDLSTAAMVQQGRVTDASGKPLAGQKVDLTYGGKTYHTLTGRNGTYRFLTPRGRPVRSQTARLVVRNVSQAVTLGSPQATIIRVK